MASRVATKLEVNIGVPFRSRKPSMGLIKSFQPSGVKLSRARTIQRCRLARFGPLMSPFGSIRRNAICRAPSSVLRRVATSEQLAWTESQVTTAISRTPLWLASGWECRGRRLSRERGSPGKRCGLCRCRPLTHRRDPVQGARALLAESLEK